jgi:hypothetical protein
VQYIFTTAKNVVKIIRQTYVSLCKQRRYFINPDNLPFGERMRAVIKIIATAHSVVVGGLISEAIGNTPIGTIPGVGEILSGRFAEHLITGIMSCTLLYFFDRNEIVNNKLIGVPKQIAYWFVVSSTTFISRQLF